MCSQKRIMKLLINEVEKVKGKGKELKCKQLLWVSKFTQTVTV